VLAPGERATTDAPGGSIVVYLTADLDGRMPPAEAVWQAPGSIDMENRGRARFEAILVEFTRTTPARATTDERVSSGTTRPYGPATTAASMRGWAGYGYGFADYTYRDRVTSDTLVSNPAVTVTRVREPGSMYLDPLRVDAAPRVIVYLRNGYAWPADAAWIGYAPDRVRRGDVRVLPASTPYTLSNAGSDPAEFVVIAQR
jgi:hypothetical protein